MRLPRFQRNRRSGLWLPEMARRLWRETDGGWYPCCCSCEILADDFDRDNSDDPGAGWTEVSGDFDVDSNVLKTTSTNAVLTRDTGHGDSAMNFKSHVRGANGDKARLIVGYIDTDNYWLVEATFGSSPRLEIFERASGANTSRVSTTGLSLAANTWYELSACVNEAGALSGTLRQTTGGFIASVNFFAELTTEDVIGLGTGGTAADVQFDNVVVNKTTATCDKCFAACNSCASSSTLTPAAWDLTLPALLPSSVSGELCHLCAALSGNTYRVYWCRPNSTGGPFLRPGCIWGRFMGECDTGLGNNNKVWLNLQVGPSATPGVANIIAGLTLQDGLPDCNHVSNTPNHSLHWGKLFSGLADCASAHELTNAGSTPAGDSNICDCDASTLYAVPIF